MFGGIYLKFDFDIYCICLVIMCNYTHVYLVACVLYCMLIWRGLFFIWASVYMHCLYVRLGATMSPMRVRAANALMRLCICLGSSELSMLAFKQIRLSYQLACVSNSFLRLRAQRRSDFVPEEEANFSSISKHILH